jgi:hypothetical protein
MTGVSLVGYSGSLVKDAVKENVGDVLSRVIGDLSSPQGSDILQPGLAEKPEATKALIGQVRGTHHENISRSDCNVAQASSLSYLRKCCKCVQHRSCIQVSPVR